MKIGGTPTLTQRRQRLRTLLDKEPSSRTAQEVKEIVQMTSRFSLMKYYLDYARSDIADALARQLRYLYRARDSYLYRRKSDQPKHLFMLWQGKLNGVVEGEVTRATGSEQESASRKQLPPLGEFV